ncbi:unnamed protein product [Plutella xylostella]|uniref:(diamondback moth) hypothetical protein n=1 Tax=Plutella xylostella TaxID=51655 RepID=A0A8S4G2K6_PLUXY|nr:unnamed protein product [Plutella xylostella]
MSVQECFVERVKKDAYTKLQVNGVRTILALENETISVECSSLIAGRCEVKINATKADAGEWHCHIGTSTVGLESKQKIVVRIVDKLAAVEPNLTVVHARPATLLCVSAQTLTPLSYCRFEPPSGSPFSISPEVTEDKAILGRYYFPANRSLDGGACAVRLRRVRHDDRGAWTCAAGLDDGNEYVDVIHLEVQGDLDGGACAVRVRRVRHDDRGAWTCAAGLDDGNEYVDVIHLEVQGYYTMSTASVTGITFGSIAAIAVLVILGVSAWKKKTFLTGRARPEAREMAEEHEMAAVPAETGRTPVGSQRTIPSVIVESPSEPSTSIRHEH